MWSNTSRVIISKRKLKQKHDMAKLNNFIMHVLISYASSVRHFMPSHLMLTIVVNIESLQAFLFHFIC